MVNISSIAAQKTFPPSEHYCASKAALNSYTRNAAVEYAHKHIRVNSVRWVQRGGGDVHARFSPGSIYTKFRLRHADSKEETDELYEQRHEWIPMKRTGTVREVANVIAFLASEQASYVTGSDFVVDGGALAGR